MAGRLGEYLFPALGAALVVVLGVSFLLFHLGVFGVPRAPHSPSAQAGVPRSAAPAPTASPTASPPPPSPPPSTPPPAPGVAPVRLEVPAAQVNAAVETVGLDPQGVIGVPAQPADAAWYSGSAVPGDPGNAIVDGHLDWWTGPAVFGHLSQVRVGDQIAFVRADGSQVTFTVTGDQVFGANARMPASMLATTGPATVSLITCSGSWDASQSEYLQRLVVNGILA